MDQPGKVANPAPGQLKREIEQIPVPVRAWEFGLARRVRQFRPASARSFSILRLNLIGWCYFTGFFAISAAVLVYIFKPPYAIGLVPSLKRNLNASKPLSIPQTGGKKMSKRLGGNIGCKDKKKTSSHLIGFSDGSNIGSTV